MSCVVRTDSSPDLGARLCVAPSIVTTTACRSAAAMSPGLPNGSFSPCNTSRFAMSIASDARDLSGLPGGCSGKDNVTTPSAGAVRQRQATRAPALRPPTISGSFGRHGSANRQASSRVFGDPATFLPATCHGDSKRATAIERAGSSLANTARSNASGPPPAPWPSARSARA